MFKLGFLFLVLMTNSAVAGFSSYSLLTEIPVERDGGWDYLSVDEGSRRLFVSHGDQIMVIELDANKVVGEIKDTPGVHGFAIAADLGRGFSSNGREGKISIVDLKTLTTIQKVDAGQNPDAIIYNPAEHEVYAFNGKSQSVAVIDGQTGKLSATIPLDGKPEFAAVDPGLHKVFVNIEDKNTIVVIDSVSHQITATWPIAPGEEATGMDIDVKHHRLFVGCHNKMMLAVDAQSGKILDHIAIGAGVDANWFDPKTSLVFSSNSEGTVTIASVSSTGKFKAAQTLTTKARARTMALDKTTHRIYLPSAEFKPASDPKARPQPVPGTFKILVYGTK